MVKLVKNGRRGGIGRLDGEHDQRRDGGFPRLTLISKRQARVERRVEQKGERLRTSERASSGGGRDRAATTA